MTEVSEALREVYRRLAELERRLKAVSDVANQAWQVSKFQGAPQGGGGSPLIRVWIGSAIAAGSLASPSPGTVTILVRSGDGWTTSGGASESVVNCDTTGYPASKAAWATRREDGSLELVVGDC